MAVGSTVVAMTSGLIPESAASVFIARNSTYGGNWWSQFTGSLALSPILITIGMLVSLGVMGPGFFCVLCLGVRRRLPQAQFLMLAGTFPWSLGNATSMEV